MFTMEITRLIERCRQGDADALGELYKAYAQRMRGVCRRYVSDEQAVEDVLHDAFVIIFTSFDRLRDNRKAESWMMSITRRPGEDKILRTSHHQMPITWSLALKYRLDNRFGLESGLSYSRLTSDFEMGADGNTIREQQTIHYLGIPVKGIYNIYNRKMWSLYGSLGLTTEIPVHSALHSDYYVNGLHEVSDKAII